MERFDGLEQRIDNLETGIQRGQVSSYKNYNKVGEITRKINRFKLADEELEKDQRKQAEKYYELDVKTQIFSENLFSTQVDVKVFKNAR